MTLFLLKNNLDTIKIAEFVDFEYKLTFHTGFPSVDECNAKLLEFINRIDYYYSHSDEIPNLSKMERTKLYITEPTNIDNIELIESYDINIIILNKLKWRSATAFSVLQRSNRGFRLLLYITNKPNHKSESLLSNFNSIVSGFKDDKEKLFGLMLENFESLRSNKIKNINYTSDVNDNKKLMLDDFYKLTSGLTKVNNYFGV